MLSPVEFTQRLYTFKPLTEHTSCLDVYSAILIFDSPSSYKLLKERVTSTFISHMGSEKLMGMNKS